MQHTERDSAASDSNQAPSGPSQGATHTCAHSGAGQTDSHPGGTASPSQESELAREYRVPYPLYIAFDGQPVTVVGAGPVAERKIKTLLDYGARVHVIAPAANSAVQALAEEGAIRWSCRPYRHGDLQESILAIGATNDPKVNRQVYTEASQRHILVNVVDTPHLCNAIVPSIMRRGRLQIAVSTGGASPEAAQAIRLNLEQQFPGWWERYMDMLAELRVLIKERVQGTPAFRSSFYQAALEDNELRAAAQAGTHIPAEDNYARIVVPLYAQNKAATDPAGQTTETKTGDR